SLAFRERLLQGQVSERLFDRQPGEFGVEQQDLARPELDSGPVEELLQMIAVHGNRMTGMEQDRVSAGADLENERLQRILPGIQSGGEGQVSDAQRAQDRRYDAGLRSLFVAQIHLAPGRFDLQRQRREQ